MFSFIPSNDREAMSLVDFVKNYKNNPEFLDTLEELAYRIDERLEELVDKEEEFERALGDAESRVEEAFENNNHYAKGIESIRRIIRNPKGRYVDARAGILSVLADIENTVIL